MKVVFRYSGMREKQYHLAKGDTFWKLGYGDILNIFVCGENSKVHQSPETVTMRVPGTRIVVNGNTLVPFIIGKGSKGRANIHYDCSPCTGSILRLQSLCRSSWRSPCWSDQCSTFSSTDHINRATRSATVQSHVCCRRMRMQLHEPRDSKLSYTQLLHTTLGEVVRTNLSSFPHLAAG